MAARFRVRFFPAINRSGTTAARGSPSITEKGKNMKNIDIFYYGEGFATLEHIELDADASFGDLLGLLITKHDLAADTVLFVENEDEPADAKGLIGKKAGRGCVKVHVNRCRKVSVAVHFKDKTIRHEFAPSTTVARVKHLVAIKKLGMSEEEASDHHLQLAGTTTQPDPGTHLGALASCQKCKVEFDLVTTPKVNGFGEGS